MKFLSILTVSVLSMLALPSWAEITPVDQASEQPVLVELFANQNCSACPQAHKTMRDISAERDDILVLTWVVDYWDYLGEPDPMAMPVAKARQAEYAETLGLRAPYTPQSVYNGVKQCPGPRKRQVIKNIKALSKGPPSERFLIEDSGKISSVGNMLGDEALFVVRFIASDAHDTKMVNPVTSIEKLEGMQDVIHGCEQDCAVLLQSTKTGEVLSFWKAD